MNILTFDTEEWALAKAGGYGTAEKYAEYNDYLNRILDVLDERDFKATFFCTGLLAKDFPQIVKLIQSRGHEIGCHSYHHNWLNKMSREEVMNDTRMAFEELEQCMGAKVNSYRAPAFSIGKSNKWVFEILKECGITRDASIYPAERDFGGFAEFGQKAPSIVYGEHFQIKEFPICTTKLLGKELAYSGGGYFRFFPLSFVKNRMAESEYNMCYFHINDLLPEKGGVPSRQKYESYYKEKGTLKNRYVRYIKTNLGKKTALDKLMKLIRTEDFVSLEQADTMIDWQQAPSVII